MKSPKERRKQSIGMKENLEVRENKSGWGKN